MKGYRKRFRHVFLFLIFCCLLPYWSCAQTKSELEQKKHQIENEISLTNELLQNTRSDKEAVLNRYITIQRKVQKREQLIKTIRKEIKLIAKYININEEIINGLEKDLKEIQYEYNELLQNAYREKLLNGKYSFLFAATNLKDAFLRWRYLKQYEAFRIRQSRLVIDTKNNLQKRKEKLSDLSSTKNKLIIREKKEKSTLKLELDDRNKIFVQLKENEDELLAILDEKQKMAKQLTFALEDLIKSELGTDNSHRLSPSLSSDFSRARGMLSWPVEDGDVVSFFGEQNHPTLSKVMITNNGIDISIGRSNKIKACMEGEVVGEFTLPGNQRTLLIKHGEFFTVYSSMEKIFAERGDLVKTGQIIGEVSKEGNLHFEIWRQKIRLNPLDWLHP